MHQHGFVLGLDPPQTSQRSLQFSPDPLAGIKASIDLLIKGSEKGKGGERRRRERRGPRVYLYVFFRIAYEHLVLYSIFI